MDGIATPKKHGKNRNERHSVKIVLVGGFVAIVCAILPVKENIQANVDGIIEKSNIRIADVETNNENVISSIDLDEPNDSDSSDSVAQDVEVTGTLVTDYAYAEYINSLDDYNQTLNPNSIERKNYFEAAATLVFFANDTGNPKSIASGNLKIISLERIEQPDLLLGAIMDNNKIYVYLVNNGWGSADSIDITYYCELPSYDINTEPVKLDFNDFAHSRSRFEVDFMNSASVKLIDTIMLDDTSIKSVLEDNKYFSIEAEVKINDQIVSTWSFMIQLDQDGNLCIITGGLGAPSPELEKKFFIDVDSSIDTYECFKKGGHLLVTGGDIYKGVLIPNKSCEIKYYLEFFYDGNYLKTDECEATIEVNNFLDPYSIAEYVYKSGVEEYHSPVVDNWAIERDEYMK